MTTPEPECIVDLGNSLELWRVHVDSTIEQDINARSMSPAMFERLQQTIARDGRLESLPLLASTDRGLEVVSGHHRVRAARAADNDLIFALVDVSGLTHDQVAAKQLAHNAISGTDDETLLAQIFASIGDVDARLETFIDPKDLKLPNVDTTKLPHIDLDFEFRTVLLTFMPDQHDRFTAAVEALEAQTPLKDHELYLIDRDMLDWWQATMSRLHREYDAHSLTTTVSKMLDIVLAALGATSVSDVDPNAWVPLADIFGSALVPPDVADTLRDAVTRSAAAGVQTKDKPWGMLEALALDYLGAASQSKQAAAS